MANIRNQQMKVFNLFTAGEENVVDRHLIHDKGFVDVINVNTDESIIQPARTGAPTTVPHYVQHAIRENLGGVDRDIWFNTPVNYVLYGNEVYYVEREGSRYKRAYWLEETNGIHVKKSNVILGIDNFKATRENPEVEDPFRGIYDLIRPQLNKPPAGKFFIRYASLSTYTFFNTFDSFYTAKFDPQGDVKAQYDKVKSDLQSMDANLTQAIIDMGDNTPISTKLSTACKSADFKLLQDSLNMPYPSDRWYHKEGQSIESINASTLAMSILTDRSDWIKMTEWWARQTYMGYIPFKNLVKKDGVIHSVYPAKNHPGIYKTKLKYFEDMKDKINKFYDDYHDTYKGKTMSDVAGYWSHVQVNMDNLSDLQRELHGIMPVEIMNFAYHFGMKNSQITWAAQNDQWGYTQSPEVWLSDDRRLITMTEWDTVISDYIRLYREIRKSIRDYTLEDYTTGAFHYYGVEVTDDAGHRLAFQELKDPIYDKDTKPIKFTFRLDTGVEQWAHFKLVRRDLDKTTHNQMYKWLTIVSPADPDVYLENYTSMSGKDQGGYDALISDLTTTIDMGDSYDLIAEYNGSIFLAKSGEQKVYFSKTGMPDRLDATNRIKVSQPITAMQQAGAGLFIWTSDDAMYLLTGYENDGSGKNTIAIKRIANGVGIKSAGAVCALDNLVVWLADDGIHNTSGYGSAATTRGVWLPPKGKVEQSLVYNGKAYFIVEGGKTLISYDTNKKVVLRFSAPNASIYRSLSTFEGDLYATVRHNIGQNETVKLFEGDNFKQYDFTTKYFSGYSHDTRLRFNNVVISHDDVPYLYKGLKTKATKTEVHIIIDDYVVATHTLAGRDSTVIPLPTTNNVGQAIAFRLVGDLKIRSLRLRYTTHDYED